MPRKLAVAGLRETDGRRQENIRKRLKIKVLRKYRKNIPGRKKNLSEGNDGRH
jgi:hypothetical protein